VATISFAGNRRVHGQWQSSLPSRFIDELPAEHVEVLTPPGLYGGGFGAAGMAQGLKGAASPTLQAAASSELADRAARADVYASPGWRRLQARAQARPQDRFAREPQEARGITIDAQAVSAFTVGDRVFNQKFGYGRVAGIEGDKLDVLFDKAGEKKVVAKFVVAAGPGEAGDDVPF
jgi:DNA helicase-2/ATP-dependent DNA helicase PcrA